MDRLAQPSPDDRERPTSTQVTRGDAGSTNKGRDYHDLQEAAQADRAPAVHPQVS
jgi:hypothetical protein